MAFALARRLSMAQVSRMMSTHSLTKSGASASAIEHVIARDTDVVTHTNQHWDQSDPRLARFIVKPKLVNPNIAMELNAESKPESSSKRIVACDGGHPRLGHPVVFINLDKPGSHECEWCGKRFFLDHSKAERHH